MMIAVTRAWQEKQAIEAIGSNRRDRGDNCRRQARIPGIGVITTTPGRDDANNRRP